MKVRSENPKQMCQFPLEVSLEIISESATGTPPPTDHDRQIILTALSKK